MYIHTLTFVCLLSFPDRDGLRIPNVLGHQFDWPNGRALHFSFDSGRPARSGPELHGRQSDLLYLTCGVSKGIRWWPPSRLYDGGQRCQDLVCSW